MTESDRPGCKRRGQRVGLGATSGFGTPHCDLNKYKVDLERISNLKQVIKGDESDYMCDGKKTHS